MAMSFASAIAGISLHSSEDGRLLTLTGLDVGDLAVAHVENAVGDLCGLGVVGDHEDGLVELAAGLAEHLEDSVGVFGVEVAGGSLARTMAGWLMRARAWRRAAARHRRARWRRSRRPLMTLSISVR